MTLIRVDDWNFNWQGSYDFTTPVPLPSGSRIDMIAHFDNSADNLANPDPTKSVSWGDQTWEEMMIGYFSAVAVMPDGPAATTQAALGAKQD